MECEGRMKGVWEGKASQGGTKGRREGGVLEECVGEGVRSGEYEGVEYILT